MSDKSSSTVYNNVRLVPFTGPFFAVWALIWPEGFGQWFGTIVHAFRGAAGF